MNRILYSDGAKKWFLWVSQCVYNVRAIKIKINRF
jgi:hypothetical protein